MNIDALKYFHRLRRLGFSHASSRIATLHSFSANFADWARRTQRYVDMPVYPEFMRFGIDDAGIVHATEGEALQALNAKARPKFRL